MFHTVWLPVKKGKCLFNSVIGAKPKWNSPRAEVYVYDKVDNTTNFYSEISIVFGM